MANFLKKITAIVFVNIIFTFAIYADIWDYATEGDYDFKFWNSTETIHGKLLNLDVQFSGFYKNGEKFDSICSSRIINVGSSDTFYYLDSDFLKYIFGELKLNNGIILVPSMYDNKLDSKNTTYLTLYKKSYYGSVYDSLFRRKDQVIYSLEEHLHGSPDLPYMQPYIWTETTYHLANITPRTGESSYALIESDEILFGVSEHSIRIQSPQKHTDSEEKYIGILYQNRLIDDLVGDEWYHPTWNLSILDENYFIFTNLEFSVKTTNLNNIEDGVDLRFGNGIIYTSEECLLKVYNSNGVPVAETFGESLDISSFQKGVYIVHASDKTLKVRL